MTVMGQIRRSHGLIGPVLAALLLTVACSRPTGVPSDGANDGTQTPFQSSSQSAESGSEAGTHSAASEDRGQEQSLPFHDPQNVPAGTLLTVQLRQSLTAATTAANDSFEATVEQPVVINGNTVVPRGTTVMGRVQSARVSNSRPNRGYVRLALESVHVGGVDVPLQTASLFARQTSSTEPSASAIRLEKGRRLTFRLTEAVSLNVQRTRASR